MSFHDLQDEPGECSRHRLAYIAALARQLAELAAGARQPEASQWLARIEARAGAVWQTMPGSPPHALCRETDQNLIPSPIAVGDRHDSLRKLIGSLSLLAAQSGDAKLASLALQADSNLAGRLSGHAG